MTRATDAISGIGDRVRETSLAVSGGRTIPIVVGRGVGSQLISQLPSSVRRIAVVTQLGVPLPFELDGRMRLIQASPGEGAKHLAEVERLAERCVEYGLTRGDIIVGVGGGVVSDLAGFVASIYHRGIAYLNVPTTLLAMVDAAIGGKTGVNLPGGKNLVGTFWQPEAVLCDLDTLATLPDSEWLSGCGEMAKYSFLGLDHLADLPLDEQVFECAALKARVVARDERESGERALLNYGHTFAHALEAFARESPTERQIAHGEAVAIGLVFAAEVACQLGRVDNATVAHHQEVVASWGLSWLLPGWIEDDRVLDYTRADKKNQEGIRMVLDGPQGLSAVDQVPEEALRQALESMHHG
ncbi:MAG: 3-dehydroquinate synthase [Ferrimicrobium sp.]